MNSVSPLVLVSLLVAVSAATAAICLAYARHQPGGPGSDPTGAVDGRLERAVAEALSELRATSTVEREVAVKAALEHAAVLQREHLGSAAHQMRQWSSADLAAKKDVIDARLDQVHREMRGELHQLNRMVSTLAEASAQKFGQVDESLRSHVEITRRLSDSAQALSAAIASPTARGQWGERMADDVLRLAGFVENVNYRKQSQLDGASGRPDFTFPLPRGHELYMDVKFPMAGYLRFLDATTDEARRQARAGFVRDVRARVGELAKRDYATQSARQTVDYVLMFLPNEQLTGFIHESDPVLLDDAMRQRVVLCSPLTLFAFLGVIRQAHDNFMIEQTSNEMLTLIGGFEEQWHKFADQMDRVGGSLDRASRQFDELVGARRRQLERPLRQLDELRRQRDLSVAPGAPDAGDPAGDIGDAVDTGARAEPPGFEPSSEQPADQTT